MVMDNCSVGEWDWHGDKGMESCALTQWQSGPIILIANFSMQFSCQHLQ